MTSEVVNLLRIGHRFNCFQEVEKLVVDLRQFGLRVRITSSCLVEKCNQIKIDHPLEEKWKYSFVKFLCELPNSCFSFEINYIDRLSKLVLTRTNLHHNCFESLTYNQNGELQLISKSLRVIRSRTGHVLVCHATPDVQDQITLTCCTKSISFYQALYRQSDRQRKLFQRHGNVLVVHLHYGCSFNSKKTLLAISVIDNDSSTDYYTVCLVTLPDRILSSVIANCFQIFTVLNDPSSVQSVIVNHEQLLPIVWKVFPEADTLLSKSLMLQKVSTELSRHNLNSDFREKLYNTFAVCCSTSSEHEFGHAEDYLLSVGGEIGSYFETKWFGQTDIWRAIDNLRRLNKEVNAVEKAILNVKRKIAQSGYFEN